MIPIDYVCFMNQTGYAQAALTNVLALDASGRYDVRVNCIHTIQKDSFSESMYRKMQSLANKTQNPNAVQIFHLIPDMHRRVGNRLKKSIGYATFETFKPPARWISTLNQNDAVICPSEFNVKTFEKQGVRKPIIHIPHGLDMNKWNKDVLPLYKNDDFVFLFVGTWRKRKGWDILLDAWAEAFNSNDKVRLIIKTDKVDKAKRETADRMKIFGEDLAPILFESNIFSNDQMPSFYKSADCLISPNLGEGFGLPPLQAMSVNVPVIVTDFSGCCDYAREDRCILIKPNGFLHHDMMDNIPQFAYQKWPRIKTSDVSSAMKLVVDDYDSAKDKSEKAYNFVNRNYGYDKMVEKFDYMMESVYGVNPI